MKYKESMTSRFIFQLLETKKKIKKIGKKIIKVWRQRQEYFQKEYWKEKNVVLEHEKDVYRNVNNYDILNEEKECSNKRLAVYTCIFGDYDKVQEPFIKGELCDYFIITDQTISSNSSWTYIKPTNTPKGFESWHPAIKNRYYKMHPHTIFQDYEYSVYIDGNVRPIVDLYPYVIQMKKKNKKIGLFKHPIFNCLYKAAEHLKTISLVDPEIMDIQMNKYFDEGFPKEYGFFECGVIIRKHNDEVCRRVMDIWWEEYQNGVKRDQQSFTYALWKNNLSYTNVCELGPNVREDSRIRISSHKKEHQKV